MGCDYRIYKFLEITHTNGKSYIELDCERGYFLCSPMEGIDSDDEHYEELYKNRYDVYLKSDFVPMLLYEQGKFVRPQLEGKYKHRIEDKIKGGEGYDYDETRDTGKLKSMADIQTIYKIEVRELA
jgi:hypothetical protein